MPSQRNFDSGKILQSFVISTLVAEFAKQLERGEKELLPRRGTYDVDVPRYPEVWYYSPFTICSSSLSGPCIPRSSLFQLFRSTFPITSQGSFLIARTSLKYSELAWETGWTSRLRRPSVLGETSQTPQSVQSQWRSPKKCSKNLKTAKPLRVSTQD